MASALRSRPSPKRIKSSAWPCAIEAAEKFRTSPQPKETPERTKEANQNLDQEAEKRAGKAGLKPEAVERELVADRDGVTHLVETELSEALQISRGTLREALRQLQQEGLISAGARGRLSVRRIESRRSAPGA